MHQLSLRTTTTPLTLILRLKLQNTTTHIIQSHNKTPIKKQTKLTPTTIPPTHTHTTAKLNNHTTKTKKGHPPQ